MIALFAALGLAALVSLQPWAANSVEPELSVAPGIGIALGDSVAVAAAPGVDVADAHVAAGAGPANVAVKLAPTREREPVPELAIARARPVTRPASAPPPVRPPASPSPEPPSQPQPPLQPVPVSAPVPVPVSAPTPASSPAPPTRVAASYGSSPPSPIATGASVGPCVGSTADVIPVEAGDEYAFSFSFYAQPTAYRMPGVDNSIMRFAGEAGELPSFGLQLWDDGADGGRGLWASGDAMGGEHFLAPLAEGVWHEAAVYFRASSEGDGFYLVFLDGQPIDARSGVSLIGSGGSCAQIEVGLFRDAERIQETPEVSIRGAALGGTLESIQP